MCADLVNSEIIKNWPEFAHTVLDFDVGSPEKIHFVFRGQPKADCPLYPSLVRSAIAAGLEARETLQLEAAATGEFKRQARIHLPNNLIPEREDIVGWWTVMQHYGAPTRLLDWTASPFVAAYFAAEKDLEHPGEIWAVPAMRVRASTRGQESSASGANQRRAIQPLFDPCALPTISFEVPRINTDRMGAQQTAFSYSPQILADHGEVIVRVIGRKGPDMGCRRLIVRASLKIEFLRQLRRMNITARSLFPGIDGLGRSVAELMRLAADHRSGKRPDNRTI
jgi:hypothetical protein